jgi:hypothetical protein
MCRTLHIFLFLILLGNSASGQDLEPRRYAAVPKGMHGIALIYGFSKGNVVSDPSLPVSDFSITAHNIAAGYVHTYGMFGKLSRVAIALPYTAMAGDLKINGRDTSGSRNGFNDARIQWGINLTGSPALSAKEFSGFRQKTIFGLSLVLSVPTGTYHKEKLINTGANRFGFKPELGISKRFKNVYAELYSGVWFFTKNNRYLKENTLEQEPMFSIQTHICYYFKNQMWIAFNGTWFKGGETILNNVPKQDLFDNWRVGGTWSVPITRFQSVKLQFHAGAFAARGYNYNLASIGYQYIFF